MGRDPVREYIEGVLGEASADSCKFCGDLMLKRISIRHLMFEWSGGF